MVQHDAVPSTLGFLLTGIAEVGQYGSMAIYGLALDSRRVGDGHLFFAIPGTREHGWCYAEQAAAAGAVAIIADPEGLDTPLSSEMIAAGHRVAVISVNGLARHIGPIAARFYGEPSHMPKTIGVTGTNGKTSVSRYVAEALHMQDKCGWIGTLGSGLIDEVTTTADCTTPDAIRLQGHLAAFRAADARYAVLEVSSHGLTQYRTTGVEFDVAVFTNLTHDHLDYHGDMAHYAAAKFRLFECPTLRYAVINLDEAVGREWLGRLAPSITPVAYTIEGNVHKSSSIRMICAENITVSREGQCFDIRSDWGAAAFHTPLLGRFNVANLLAALGTLLVCDVNFDAAITRLEQVRGVPGRMEVFGGAGNQPLVVVDYAHTPDAMAQVLQSLRPQCSGRLWCVFGCGGERDNDKRSHMGRIAESFADCVVITEDNPRGEDSISIIDQVLRGMKDPDSAYVIRDRAAAITHVIGLALHEDIVVVAGKGHECEQWFADHCTPFSDRAQVAHILGQEAAHWLTGLQPLSSRPLIGLELSCSVVTASLLASAATAVTCIRGRYLLRSMVPTTTDTVTSRRQWKRVLPLHWWTIAVSRPCHNWSWMIHALPWVALLLPGVRLLD